MNKEMKRRLQAMVDAMPESLQMALSYPMQLYSRQDQMKRLNVAVQETAHLIGERSSAAQPRVFVDCGCNNGTTLKRFVETLPDDFVFYGFEIQPELKELAEKALAQHAHRLVRVEAAGVSDCDNDIAYFPSKTVAWGGMFDRIATTMFEDSLEKSHLDYSMRRTAKGMDFSRWLSGVYKRHTTPEGVTPFIAIKMNIEGAEYPSLGKVAEDGNFHMIGMLAAEFHLDKFEGDTRQQFEAPHRKIWEAMEIHNTPYIDWTHP